MGLKSQTIGVVESNNTIFYLGVSLPQNGIPVEIGMTTGLMDDFLGIENFHLCLDIFFRTKFKEPTYGRVMAGGFGINLRYSLFDDFDLFFSGDIGIPYAPNVWLFAQNDDFITLEYFLNVGVSYAFSEYFGAYAKCGYSNFGYTGAGLFVRF
jgi:hypothetical protein